MESWAWPQSDDGLVELQEHLAVAAARVAVTDPWLPVAAQPLLGGCFVAYGRGATGSGKRGDRAWAAAVVWRVDVDRGSRKTDRHLKGAATPGQPRQADDIVAQSYVSECVPSPYVPGFLARREGPILAAALAALEVRPELLLVSATGLDHPRGAGLAVHLGAVVDLPTVGVTRRPLIRLG
jgi:deoxyribonuclease V